MSQALDFYTLNELFLNIGAVESPAQLQGLLCGRLCGGDVSQNEWHAIAMKCMGLEGMELHDEESRILDSVYDETIRLLNDVNFGFSPLLPGDESSIVRRTIELGAWCEGFLKGLAASGLSGEDTLSPIVTEGLRDIAQVSQVNIDDADEAEENEVYWQDIVEHVKVIVLNIYTELSHSHAQVRSGGVDNERRKPEPDDKVVH